MFSEYFSAESLARFFRDRQIGEKLTPNNALHELVNNWDRPLSLPVQSGDFKLDSRVNKALTFSFTHINSHLDYDRLFPGKKVTHVDGNCIFSLEANINHLPATWPEASIRQVQDIGIIACLGFDICSPDNNLRWGWDPHLPSFMVVSGVKSAQFYPRDQTVGKEYNFLLGWQWRHCLLHFTEQLAIWLNQQGLSFPGIIIREHNWREESNRLDSHRPRRLGNKPTNPASQMERLWQAATNYQSHTVTGGLTWLKYARVEDFSVDVPVQKLFDRIYSGKMIE